MIPHWLSVVILLAAGAGLLKVAHRGWCEGRVRAGSSLHGVWEPGRDSHPVAFRFFVGMYFCGGLALSVWGLLALVGMAPDLRLGSP